MKMHSLPRVQILHKTETVTIHFGNARTHFLCQRVNLL